MRTSFGVPQATLLLATLWVWGAAPVAAQSIGVGDPLEDYARVLSLLDSAPHPSFSVRPLSDSAWGTVLQGEDHPWASRLPRSGGKGWRATPLSIRTTFNSAYPAGQNDGLMWQGKGASEFVEAGVTWRRGRFEATLRPQYAWSANAAFELAPVGYPGRTKYANAWRPSPTGKGSFVDLPQRMGPNDYSELSLGESSLRFRFGGWAMGASNEHMWWGPAQRNPIILSNNAPGFLHGFVGTTRPVQIPGGHAELRWIWGGLKGSEWSDSVPNDRNRYMTAIVAALHPNFLPGLSMGATRAFQMYPPPGGIGGKDLFLVLQGVTKVTQVTDSNPEGNDDRDQLLSLFARYASPGSGFEAYIEWGRNDHSWDTRDFLLEPEHSSASTIGLQKVLRLRGSRILRLAGEWTNVQRTLTQLVRPAGSWYTHSQIHEGWTQGGQLLGTAIGPGSTAQALWGDFFSKWGRTGLMFQRIARDNDALYQNFAGDPQDRERHQVELSAQLSTMVFWRGLEVEGVLGVEKTLNRNFDYRNDVTNVHLELGARSRLPQWP